MLLQVRPTLRALRLLPADSYDSAAILSTIARARATTNLEERRMILNSLTLDAIQHPLLDDARDRFKNGTPDLHQSSTRAVGRNVYEVRSTTGAAWRGAVTCEGQTAWLVFADRHDSFHAAAAEYLANASWEPGPLDRELSAQDLAKAKLREWKAEVLTSLLEHLSAAATAPGRTVFTTPANPEGQACTLEVSVEHDAPAADAAHAHTSSGMVEVVVRINATAWSIVEHVLPLLDFIQAEGVPVEPAFLPGGDLLLLMTLTHARLAQLSTQVVQAGSKAPTGAFLAPTYLHYVGKAHLAKSFVEGDAVQSLCGVWFVPVTDASAALPVCPRCEATEPYAQKLLNLLRS